MDAVEFIKEYQRMCNSYTTNVVNNFDCCVGCPLYGQPCDLASLVVSPQDIITKVEQWSQTHPRKTMMQDFFEKHPNAPKNPNGTPQFCPRYAGYSQQKDCTGCVNKYLECWSRPLEE